MDSTAANLSPKYSAYPVSWLQFQNDRNLLMSLPTQDGVHQKVANRLTARVIPIILVGIVGYVSYVVIVLVCGQFSREEKRIELRASC